jgi:hypothetical protein
VTYRLEPTAGIRFAWTHTPASPAPGLRHVQAARQRTPERWSTSACRRSWPRATPGTLPEALRGRPGPAPRQRSSPARGERRVPRKGGGTHHLAVMSRAGSAANVGYGDRGNAAVQSEAAAVPLGIDQLGQLVAARRAYQLPIAPVAGTVDGEVQAGVGEAQLPVRATDDPGGDLVVGPTVVGPETYRAGRAARPVTTAGAGLERGVTHAGELFTALPVRVTGAARVCGSCTIGPRRPAHRNLLMERGYRFR